MERDCLNFLLHVTHPILVMPARPLELFRPPEAWSGAIAEGRMILESSFLANKRGIPIANARTRDCALACRAASALIAYAHLYGGVKRMALDLIASRKKLVWMLDLRRTAVLLVAGARLQS